MFNGIIYNQGKISKISKRPKGINIFVKSNFKLKKKILDYQLLVMGFV